MAHGDATTPQYLDFAPWVYPREATEEERKAQRDWHAELATRGDVTIADGATVNRGCVVQTHLFHDRVLSTDTVTLEAGATLGPNSVILPAATIGRHATVGPVSLVMRGEAVPSRTCWIGNPIGPWEAP